MLPLFCCFYYSITTTVVFDFARRFQLLELCYSCFVIVYRSFIVFICWLLLLTYIYINL